MLQVRSHAIDRGAAVQHARPDPAVAAGFDFHHDLAHHAFGNAQAVGPYRIAETHDDPVRARQARDRTLTLFARRLG